MLKIHQFSKPVVDDDDDDKEQERPLYLLDFMQKIVHSRARADVIFTVKDNKSGESKEIPAHRFILAVASKVFEAMLYPPKRPSGERPKVKIPLRIPINDTTHEAFLSLLQCIYTDEVEVETTTLSELLKLAQKYQIEKLHSVCCDFMSKDVTVENACELFEMAPKLLGDEDFGMAFIRENANEVLKSDGFLRLSARRLEYILKDDEIGIEEIELFHALLAWGKAEVERRGDDMKGSEGARLKEIVTPYLQYIRFPNMEMDDLASHVQPAALLSPEELLPLFTYVSLDEDGRSKLKVGFNTKPRAGGKRLKFSSILDTNGLIYLIGTSQGAHAYSNPVKTGKVLVKLSSSGGSAVEYVADRNPSSHPVENSYGSDRNPWISFSFPGYLLRPTEYVVCQDQDHFIQNWRFEGKEKGKSDWTLIKEYKNDPTMLSARGVFKVSTAKMFSEFRIYLTGNSHKGQPNFDITYVEFYGYYKETR